MIFLFLGEGYFRKKDLNVWKNHFIQKYSENNLFHIKNIFDYDISFFEQNLFSQGLFSSKNLIIIDDFPFGNTETEKENDKTIQLREYFLQKLPLISDENILIFNQEKVDKRSKLYKEILKIGELKDFTISTQDDLVKKISQEYKDQITLKEIYKLIELKGIHYGLISGEIDKILLTKNRVELQDLEDISKDIEEDIFEIITGFLQLNFAQSFEKLDLLSNKIDNPYYLYNIIISNLRFYFYIFLLKEKGYSSTQIKKTFPVGNRGFLVDRNLKISPKQFFNIFESMTLIDSQMKGGKLLGNQGDEIIYAIKKSFLRGV